MDIRSDNPVGRVPDPRWMSYETLRLRPQGWRLGTRRGGWADDLEKHLSRLDNVHELRVHDDSPHDAAAPVGRFLQRAIARGTFVSGRLSAHVQDNLPPDVRELVRPGTDARAGDLVWDIASVVQRRAVLRTMVPELPALSAVLVSRRPELIAPVVQMLSQIDYPRLEIVVGVHGAPAPPGLAAAAGDRELVVREFPADLVFGQVLQQAFAVASGDLVTKVDDDDYMSDRHLLDLVLAHRYSGANLVGKSTTVVYLEAIDTTVRRLFGVRETFTHRVAGSTFLLSPADLAEAGGWPAVPRAVDTAFIEALRRRHGTIYQPHDIGYLYVRRQDATEHTWHARVGHFLRNTREQWVGLLHHPEFGTHRLEAGHGPQPGRHPSGSEPGPWQGQVAM